MAPTGTMLRSRRAQRCRTAFLALLVVCVARGDRMADEAVASEGRREEAIGDFMQKNRVPGLSAAVVKNGKVAWARGFGHADRERGIPATATTLFRVASLSKSLTAVAALQLWERGTLDLDAPVGKYCSAYGARDVSPTTRHLLGHLGGIRGYRDDSELYDVRHYDSVASAIPLFANDAPVAPVGHAFVYSTHGYTLVGCAIEGAAGTSYSRYVHENVLSVAAMRDTTLDDSRVSAERRSRFYHRERDGTESSAERFDASYKLPGGGWLSSADDMARFVVALFDERLVRSATRGMMWQPGRTEGGAPTHYGLGWRMDVVDGKRAVAHEGRAPGTSAQIVLLPDERAAVVVLANVDGLSLSELAATLLRLTLEP